MKHIIIYTLYIYILYRLYVYLYTYSSYIPTSGYQTWLAEKSSIYRQLSHCITTSSIAMFVSGHYSSHQDHPEDDSPKHTISTKDLL